MSTELECPHANLKSVPIAGLGAQNRDWWPHQLRVDLLSQHSTKSDPLGPSFDYRKAFKELDYEGLKRDLRARWIAAWLACADWAEPAVLSGPFERVRGAPPEAPAGPRGWRPPFDEHEQDPARMRAYIDWELALLDRVAQDGTLAFGALPPGTEAEDPAG